ncbi:NADP-dependent oxidoreductase [Kitasatospora sp. NPDC094015]|uniref:NADP-dependent oxidoreductase n=1 Tax=Kitasatospora sp. NPDC094015 TaxID=3155205 RepID=UPI003326889F
MRAVVFSRYGDESVLEAVELPVPVPAAGEVLVRVRAAAVNPVDWKLREGWVPMDRPFPRGLGFDVAGVVVGSAAPDGPPVGAEVYGMLPLPHGAAYQEYTAVPAAALAPVPAGLDLEQAAAVPMAALTAWQALDAAGVKGGERVLVQGGAGGVGHLAVQLAKARGAHVLATASARNLDFLRELGVDEPLDHGADDLRTLAPVDVVIDAVGGQVQRDSWALLRPGGTLITLPEPLDEAHRLPGIDAHRVVVVPDGPTLTLVGELIAEGRLRIEVQQVLPLDRAAQAHRISAAGRVRGKLVLSL